MPLYTDKCTFHQVRKQRVAGFLLVFFVCLFVCLLFVDFFLFFIFFLVVVVVVDLCLLLLSFTHMNE